MKLPDSISPLLVVASVALASASSCISSHNPLYCGDQPNCDAGTPDVTASSDAVLSCASTCTAPTAACDTASGMCVQCTTTDETACSGTSPACGDDHACRACEAHSECASAACLPDGSCADPGIVAYVDAAGTSNSVCSFALPCTKVADALSTGRPYVKITGTLFEGVTISGTRNVTFLGAPGATLTRTDNGSVLVLEDGAQVAVYDLEISGALGGATGIALPLTGTMSLTLVRTRILNNSGGGISAGTGSLSISKSTISGNVSRGISMSNGILTISQSRIASNGGGGILLSNAQFDLINNFIVNNGSGSSSVGGIKIGDVSAAIGPTHRLDFNTIAANSGPPALNAGVSCGSGVAEPVTFSNNIIYGNMSSVPQIGGNANCETAYSDIGPVAVAGTGNINADPKFVNAAQGDFHLASNSPAKDAAGPDATLGIDFDSDTRPYGPARDIGADEVVTP